MSEEWEPVLLYKYRSLSGEFGQPAVEDAILRNELFWQSPAMFNDPSDCAPRLEFGRGRLGREAYIRRAVRRQIPDRVARKHAAKNAIARGWKWNAELLEQGFSQLMEMSAVSCFSDVGDSVLMWSHYADSHKGICLVFKETLGEPPFVPFTVEYSEKRPKIDIMEGFDENAFRLSILTKSDAWSYERERRFVDYRIGPGKRRFPKEALVGVVLGAKISEPDEAFMLGLIEQRPDLKWARASLAKDEYRIVHDLLR